MHLDLILIVVLSAQPIVTRVGRVASGPNSGYGGKGIYIGSSKIAS